MTVLLDEHNFARRSNCNNVYPIDAFDDEKIMFLPGAGRNNAIGADTENAEIGSLTRIEFLPGLEHLRLGFGTDTTQGTTPVGKTYVSAFTFTFRFPLLPSPGA